MDAVERANPGHPRKPMGMENATEVPLNDFLRFNPANPAWANGDRFVVSNGHGCMLLYAQLHLTGCDYLIDGDRAQWPLAFSYARALREPPLPIWKGDNANIDKAQAALVHRAKCNSQAACACCEPGLDLDAA